MSSRPSVLRLACAAASCERTRESRVRDDVRSGLVRAWGGGSGVTGHTQPCGWRGCLWTLHYVTSHVIGHPRPTARGGLVAKLATRAGRATGGRRGPALGGLGCCNFAFSMWLPRLGTYRTLPE
eukprot:618971-Prymnesium_polylepis.1